MVMDIGTPPLSNTKKQSWRGSLVEILTRSELVAWRNIALVIVRDKIFVGLVVFVAVIAVLAVYQIGKSASSMPIKASVGAILVGFGLFHLSYCTPHSSRRISLMSGPFHSRTSFGPELEHWCRLRAGAISFICLALLSMTIALGNPMIAVLFFLLGLFGAVLRFCGILAISGHRLPRWRLRPMKFVATRPEFLPKSWWLSLTTALRRKGKTAPEPYVIAAAWLLGGASAGLASRNNADSHLGFIILITVSLLCGAILSWPDISLLRFVSYCGAKTHRIALTIGLPRLALSLTVGLVAILVSALPVSLQLISFGLITVSLTFWVFLIISYGMTKSPGGALLFAVCDLVIAALINAVFLTGIPSALWLAGKIGFNYHRIDRNRWREAK
ncbi:hypothetical protein MMA231_03011 [Asticcacaulis sp. MM231]|uniref:hypothetical protein n=1 Tax=Asticcacaulis sp. MM231 TaxID=3157666 RepID=UPI0032D56AEA